MMGRWQTGSHSRCHSPRRHTSSPTKGRQSRARRCRTVRRGYRQKPRTPVTWARTRGEAMAVMATAAATEWTDSRRDEQRPGMRSVGCSVAGGGGQAAVREALELIHEAMEEGRRSLALCERRLPKKLLVQLFHAGHQLIIHIIIHDARASSEDGVPPQIARQHVAHGYSASCLLLEHTGVGHPPVAAVTLDLTLICGSVERGTQTT